MFPTRRPICRQLASAGLLLAGALVLASCGIFAPTITIQSTKPDNVHALLAENALNTSGLSTRTREVLHTYGLADLQGSYPRAALAELHDRTLIEPTRANLFAMAECAYRIGRDQNDRDACLAAAIYAWHYLLGTEDPEPANAYDRRFRWACDLYNDALLRALATPDGRQLKLEAGPRSWIFGTIRIGFDSSALAWTPGADTAYLPADGFLIHGLSLRLRDSGLGVPLIATRGAASNSKERSILTALLRVTGPASVPDESLDATLELHSVFTAPSVEVGKTTVPLESDLSTGLAYALDKSNLWDFSLTGLFSGEDASKSNRLICVPPTSTHRIPVVFVHGTASNPAYWAEMFNTLQADPALRERTQFWFFQYTTGNPILYSAATLRDAIRAKLKELDPEGNDPELNQMVIIGHSQGGLIAKLMVVDGSMDWLAETLHKPVASLGLAPDTLKLLTWAYDFKAMPEVKRVVFISTPQHGSFLSESWFARMIARFIALPGDLNNAIASIAGKATLPEELGGRLPTSLDNMNPSNPFLQILARTPIVPGVKAHSIISIGDANPNDPESLENADDGVVKYTSAHIEPVESELLVRLPHSCQDAPAVIQEVRRILHEHLGIK